MNPTILTKLRNVLARLFPDETSIRRIVDDAGLERQKIDFGSSAINVWHSVLMEAEKVDRVDALLRVVESEYGNNREFQAACQAYRQSQGKQETVNLPSSAPIHQPKTSPNPWSQRLPSLWMGILLIGLAGGSVYWVWGGLPSSGNITPIATITAPASAASEEKSAEGSPTLVELPTATTVAVLPSPTTIATATTAPTPTATIPEPTNIPSEVEPVLCSFAFLVLDDQTEEPIRRATIVVFVGVRQVTGTTDSTGYYLAKLPCNNEQDVEAQARVSADGYNPYNKSLFLNNETTEILLKSRATPKPITMATTIPTLTPLLSVTVAPDLEPTVITQSVIEGYLCEVTIQPSTGADFIQLVRSSPVATASTIEKLFTKGTTVFILQKPPTNGMYEIWSDSKTKIGWIPAEDLSLPRCAN